MTVEELEIIIEAQIEPALKELEKLTPSIKSIIQKATKAVNEEMSNINTTTMTEKINVAAQKVKTTMKSIKGDGVGTELTKQFNKAGTGVSKYEQKLEEAKTKLALVGSQMDEIYAKEFNNSAFDGYESVEGGEESVAKSVDISLSGNSQYNSLIAKEQQLNSLVAQLNTQLAQARGNYSALSSQISSANTGQSKLSKAVSTLKTKMESVKKATSKLPASFKTASTQASKMSGKLSLGLKSLLKYAGALFSIRSIYTVLSSAANSWLSSTDSAAQQLKANIDYMSYAMGSAFAPVIEYVISLVYSLLKAIQSVVYALFSVDIFANASADAYDSMANSAESASEASKSLAGVHGEINNVSESSGSSGGSGSSVGANFDLAGVDTSITMLDGVVDALAIVKQIITNIKDAFSTAFTTGDSGSNILTNLKDSLFSILNIIEMITGSEGFQLFIEILVGAFEGLTTAVSWVLEKLEGFVSYLTGNSDEISNWSIIVGVLTTAIIAAIAAYKLVVAGIAIYNIVTRVAASATWSALAPILAVIAVIALVVAAIWLVANNWDVIKEKAIEVWDKIKEVLSSIGGWINDNVIQPIANFFKALWEGIKTLVSYYILYLKTIFITIPLWIYNNIILPIVNFFIGLWDSIVSVFNVVGDFFKNVFTTAWTNIKSAFSAVGTFFSGVWTTIKDMFTSIGSTIGDAISGAFKTVVNSIINFAENTINGFIKAINLAISLINAIPGVSISTLSTLNIPRLANGGVATSPMIAEIGEYSGAGTNPEIVAPQSILKSTFEEVLSKKSSGGTQSIKINIGNKAFVDDVIDYINDKSRRLGKNVILEVGG